MSTIDLETVKRLEKRLGVWVWDGVLYNRDSITNPKLTILPNQAGTCIRRFLAEMAKPEPQGVIPQKPGEHKPMWQRIDAEYWRKRNADADARLEEQVQQITTFKRKAGQGGKLKRNA